MKKKILVLFFCISIFAQDIPKWVIDPTLGGSINGGVGCAPKQKDFKTQEKMALLLAKSDISQSIQTDVEDIIDLENIDGELDVNSSSKFESSSTFQITEKDRYIDKNGKLCIWVVKQ
jgi:hypothetical protein